MRKKQAVKKDVLPDPIYNSKVVTKLINSIMLDGKKGTAQKILYDAFEMVKEKTGKEPMEVFNQALENAGVHTETGIFGAMMKVSLINDGPTTIILDSKEII